MLPAFLRQRVRFEPLRLQDLETVDVQVTPDEERFVSDFHAESVTALHVHQATGLDVEPRLLLDLPHHGLRELLALDGIARGQSPRALRRPHPVLEEKDLSLVVTDDSRDAHHELRVGEPQNPPLQGPRTSRHSRTTTRFMNAPFSESGSVPGARPRRLQPHGSADGHARVPRHITHGRSTISAKPVCSGCARRCSNGHVCARTGSVPGSLSAPHSVSSSSSARHRNRYAHGVHPGTARDGDATRGPRRGRAARCRVGAVLRSRPTTRTGVVTTRICAHSASVGRRTFSGSAAHSAPPPGAAGTRSPRSSASPCRTGTLHRWCPPRSSSRWEPTVVAHASPPVGNRLVPAPVDRSCTWS